MDYFHHVSGINRGLVRLYALSTCIWCRKTKKLLDDLGVDYYFADVDQLTGETKEDALQCLKQWNPKGSFPTIVINDSFSIVGFEEANIREVLGNG